MSPNRTSSGGAKALPMSVENVGFLLDRLGQDCHPLQYLRELTQNSIEAIARTGEPGEIVWDVDWISYDLGTEKVFKLCVTDTGDGMRGDEMLRFINNLSSSLSEQSFSGNFGVGAKIAAATRNPCGVLYQSWKDGDGSMILLRRDPETRQYGVVRWELEGGNFEHYVPLEDDVKPTQLDGHGTKVILLGKAENEDTMAAPEGAPSPSRWVTKYLNTRYFKFPDGVTVKAREGWENPRQDTDRNILRTITGQKVYLDNHAEQSGVHDIKGARIHWWILRDEPAITNNSGFVESGGHTAALFNDELYDRATARAGVARLQLFGITFGYRFVVLYVEPIEQDGVTLTTNTARTTLLLNGQELPWADWAYEFRENMPKQLADFVRDKSSQSTEKDHLKSIKDRLKGILDLYRVTRYRPTPAGDYLSDESSSVRIGPADDAGRTSAGGGGRGATPGATSKGARDGEIGSIYHLFEKKGGKPSDQTKSDPFPIPKWVSVADETRDADLMEDRAAKYIPEQNLLLINADFRVYKDMIGRLNREYQEIAGVEVTDVVSDVVRGWFEQALIETVIGVQALRGSKEWGQDKITSALSEEALTAAVMQRYHVHIACRRELGAKLGKARTGSDDF